MTPAQRTHMLHCHGLIREMEDSAPVTVDTRYELYLALSNYAVIERESVEACTPQRRMTP